MEPSGSFATSFALRDQRSEPWREALRICVPCGRPGQQHVQQF